MKRLWIFAATLSGALAVTSAYSAAPGEHLEGHADAGASKAAVCTACHGPTGNSVNPDWPSLAGLGGDYVAEQLKNFKDGKRNNPVMMPIAAPLQPQDMADLGAYFATLSNTGLEADPSYWQAGEKLYRGGDTARGIPACLACHGPTGKGNSAAKFPALRGQQSGYFTKQLNDYASGARTTDSNAIMQTVAKRLSPEDIRNLAAYVKGIR
jgi:cytochrome c553